MARHRLASFARLSAFEVRDEVVALVSIRCVVSVRTVTVVNGFKGLDLEPDRAPVVHWVSQPHFECDLSFKARPDGIDCAELSRVLNFLAAEPGRVARLTLSADLAAFLKKRGRSRLDCRGITDDDTQRCSLHDGRRLESDLIVGFLTVLFVVLHDGVPAQAQQLTQVVRLDVDGIVVRGDIVPKARRLHDARELAAATKTGRVDDIAHLDLVQASGGLNIVQRDLQLIVSVCAFRRAERIERLGLAVHF